MGYDGLWGIRLVRAKTASEDAADDVVRVVRHARSDGVRSGDGPDPTTTSPWDEIPRTTPTTPAATTTAATSTPPQGSAFDDGPTEEIPVRKFTSLKPLAELDRLRAQTPL